MLVGEFKLAQNIKSGDVIWVGEDKITVDKVHLLDSVLIEDDRGYEFVYEFGEDLEVCK